jgi:hypothetical protein
MNRDHLLPIGICEFLERMHDLDARVTHENVDASDGKLLGHTRAATTAHYAHLDADPLRRASEIIAGQIASALSDARAAAGEVMPVPTKRTP